MKLQIIPLGLILPKVLVSAQASSEAGDSILPLPTAFPTIAAALTNDRSVVLTSFHGENSGAGAPFVYLQYEDLFLYSLSRTATPIVVSSSVFNDNRYRVRIMGGAFFANAFLVENSNLLKRFC